jgi:hypothetical protein
MATNKRQQFRTSRESGFPPNSTNNDKTEEPFNGNGSSKYKTIISNVFSPINYC